MPEQVTNLVNLIDRFHSEDSCRTALEKLRWPDGVSCFRCGAKTVSRISTVNKFECSKCEYQFSVTTGTIFHDTHLPLWKWFLTTYTMCESKKGVSANQIKRMLGISYKTAWYLCHRIRAAMTEASPKLLGGTVEADETWVGGKRKGVGHGYRGNKTIVAGVIQRDGDVRLKVIGDTTRRTLHTFLGDHIRPDTERIITDDWPAYQGLTNHDTKHETVNHSLDEWVRGDIHTNTVENVWSLLKRSIVGSYHHLSEKHLDAYLDELEWRFNNRENPSLFRDTLVKLIQSERLEYSTLTA